MTVSTRSTRTGIVKKDGNPQVAVIGSGPAGAATALCLARAGISVALIERAAPSGCPTIWKIGEGLPPAARPVLQRLGVWDEFIADGHLISYGNATAWGSAALVEQNFLFNPHGHGWHLDRARFDAMLTRAAQNAGARFHQAVITNVEPTAENGWQLTLNHSTQLHAGFVVDATGRRSWFARQLGLLREQSDKLVGCAVLLSPNGAVGQVPNLPHSAHADHNSLTLVEAVADGWWYAALLPNNKLVAVFLSDGNLPASQTTRNTQGWLSLLKQTRHLRERIAKYSYVIEQGPRVVAANSTRLNACCGKSWLAVGDAAMAYDPLSSQGLLAAMETAEQAATAIQSDSLSEYRNSIDQQWNDYLKQWQFYYAQERRWPDTVFWQRRHLAANTNFLTGVARHSYKVATFSSSVTTTL